MKTKKKKSAPKKLSDTHSRGDLLLMYLTKTLKEDTLKELKVTCSPILDMCSTLAKNPNKTKTKYTHTSDVFFEFLRAYADRMKELNKKDATAN